MWVLSQNFWRWCMIIYGGVATWLRNCCERDTPMWSEPLFSRNFELEIIRQLPCIFLSSLAKSALCQVFDQELMFELSKWIPTKSRFYLWTGKKTRKLPNVLKSKSRLKSGSELHENASLTAISWLHSHFL